MDHKQGEGVVDWIQVTKDSVKWRSIVNVITNLRFPKTQEMS